MRAKSTMGLALLALVLGCGERDAGIENAPRIVDRARLGKELLFVDANRAEIDALDVTSKNPTPTVDRVPIRANPRFVVERREWASHVSASTAASGAGSGGGGGTAPVVYDPLNESVPEGRGAAPEEVLVLSDGSRDALGEYRDLPTLTAINTKHEVRHYELSQPMANLRLSEDGQYAILWGQPANGQDDSLLRDPNRVALVDLTQPPSKENPFERTLKATGGDITDVLLTPTLQIPSGVRPVALFSFGNGLGVWDITNPAHEDITAEGLAQGKMQLRRVVADMSEAKLYLVQTGLEDLRVLSFGPSEDPDASNDFALSLNQLPLALNGASDMVPYIDGSVSKVLVTTGNKLAVVDADDSRVTPVNLATFGDHLHRFTGRSPDDPTTKPRILAWAAAQTKVSFVELSDLEHAGSKNIEELSLGYAVSDLIALSGNRMLAILSGNGVGVIELENRRFQRLASTFKLMSPLIESDSQRIWIGTSDRVGYFEPAALKTGSLRLDENVQELFLFEDADQCRVVATHDNAIGHVTIIDGEKATRSSSRALVGFLVDGLVK